MALSTAYVAHVLKSLIDEAFGTRSQQAVNWICLSIFLAFALRGFASYGQAVALSKLLITAANRKTTTRRLLLGVAA
jgi:ATP-binding cassette, subfamily B, bacterial MsbA